MKGDNNSSSSQSQYGQDPITAAHDSSQGSSIKIQKEQARAYWLDEQAPPGYQAVEAPSEYSDRQPLIRASASGTGVQGPPPVGPRQLDADFFVDVMLYIVALAVPPASVVVKRGCDAQFWLNIVLTMLGGFPGLIHAWYIIAVTPGTIRNQAARETAATVNEDAEQGREGARIELR